MHWIFHTCTFTYAVLYLFILKLLRVILCLFLRQNAGSCIRYFLLCFTLCSNSKYDSKKIAYSFMFKKTHYIYYSFWCFWLYSVYNFILKIRKIYETTLAYVWMSVADSFARDFWNGYHLYVSFVCKFIRYQLWTSKFLRTPPNNRIHNVKQSNSVLSCVFSRK